MNQASSLLALIKAAGDDFVDCLGSMSSSVWQGAAVHSGVEMVEGSCSYRESVFSRSCDRIAYLHAML